MIEYGNIYLRALERTDLESLQKWRNIDNFRVNFREYRELNLDQQNRWFDSLQKDGANHLMFGVCERESGELIGAAGLCYIHWVYKNADLSFYIGKNELYADDVFAKDTVKALISYGFQSLNLKRIWCELYEYDNKKVELLSKIGFKKEGILRCNTFKKGKYFDGHIWAILSEEFMPTK